MQQNNNNEQTDLDAQIERVGQQLERVREKKRKYQSAEIALVERLYALQNQALDENEANNPIIESNDEPNPRACARRDDASVASTNDSNAGVAEIAAFTSGARVRILNAVPTSASTPSTFQPTTFGWVTRTSQKRVFFTTDSGHQLSRAPKHLELLP